MPLESCNDDNDPILQRASRPTCLDVFIVNSFQLSSIVQITTSKRESKKIPVGIQTSFYFTENLVVDRSIIFIPVSTREINCLLSKVRTVPNNTINTTTGMYY